MNVILDPFVTGGGAPSEYGINLMACFFIVHHHGGKIEAKRQSGGGNAFTVRLPLQPALAAAPDETAFLQKAILNDELWEKLLASG